MIKKFSSRIFLICFFSLFLLPKNIQTDFPRYVEREYKEYFDLGNGVGIAIQRNGYFIEDENGNVFYTEKSKTQFIEKPDYLEGESTVVYENNSRIDHFIPSDKPNEKKEKSNIDIGSESPGDLTDWEKQALSTHRTNFRREFSRDVRRIFDAARVYSNWNSTPHQVGEIPPYIGSKNSYHPNESNRFIQKFSMYKYKDGKVTVRNDSENLIKTFCREVIGKHTKMYVDWCSATASLQTLDRLEDELDTNKKLKQKVLNRLEDVFGENYLNLFINTYKLNLNERLRVEKFEKMRVVERKENKQLGVWLTAQKKVVQEKIERLTKELSDKLIDAVKDLGLDATAVGDQKKQWFEVELKLQQQDGTIFLTKEKLKVFEDMRLYLDKTKHIEVSKAYLGMLKQAEIEQLQNDGKISKKLYNRLIAAHVAINNKFKSAKSNYILNNYAHQHVSQNMCDIYLLEKYCGNGIQHNVHREIVGLVNRYSYYLHANGNGPAGDGPNLYEAANIALELKKKLDGKSESAKTEIYERAYSFLDFCHNLLKVKIGKTALNFWHRFGKGLELGGIDIQKVFKNGLSSCFQSKFFDDGDSLLAILDGKQNLEKILEKQKATFDCKRKKLGDSISNLFQKVKDQPLEETVGDALEFLSRKLVQTSAVIVTALGITTVAEAGLAVAAGVGSAVTAKKLLEPFVVKVAADGSAVLDKAFSSGVSVCQTVASSLSQAIETLCGLSDAANNLCFAMQVGGGGPDKIFVRKERLDGSAGIDSDELIKSLDSLNDNDIYHILQEKHNWCKVVDDPGDWRQVLKIIKKVLWEGEDRPHKRVLKRVLIVSESLVEVTYRKLGSGAVRVGNAWVN